MARVLVEGFETASLSSYYNNYGCSIVSTSGTAMSGNYCLFLDGTAYIYRVLPVTLSQAYITFKFRTTAGNTGLFKLLDTNNIVILSIYYNHDTSSISVYRGAYTTLLCTSTTPILPDITYLLGIHYVPNTSTGVVELKINNTPVEASFIGNTTAGLTTFNRFAFEASSSRKPCFDDLIIDDANWIGNSRIKAIVPTGAGNSTSWTASTGSNYACLDEIAPSDTDYVSTNVTDNIDTYAFSDISGTTSIKSVSVTARCGYDGTPTPKNVQMVTRVGGTDYTGTTIAVPLSFSSLTPQIWENNPATGTAWTEATLNAAEFGIKAVA